MILFIAASKRRFRAQFLRCAIVIIFAYFIDIKPRFNKEKKLRKNAKAKMSSDVKYCRGRHLYLFNEDFHNGETNETTQNLDVDSTSFIGLFLTCRRSSRGVVDRFVFNFRFVGSFSFDDMTRRIGDLKILPMEGRRVVFSPMI